MSTIDGLEQKITSNRADANDRRREILADRNLSAEGKQAAIAELDAGAKEQHAALRKEHSAAVAAERQRLQQAAFRKPSATLAIEQHTADANWRNALSVAEQADAAGLRRIVNRTKLTGDKVQRRAALLIAAERNDLELLESAADDDPAIADLLAFERRHGKLATMTERVARSARLSGPSAA